ncbi:uncharacterized protein RJT20DRAFT_16877 [Scheffersomyces xylosifermentans]|uniref:uncharacterized protein n=1 Tax=Scheffersomyces xylosifermentans TaxID=1304137 RepID=UPI00315CF43C
MREISQEKQERLNRLNKQLWQAGLTGVLQGTLVALVSGYYINYKYNHGVNRGFFKTPYKVAWFMCWNIVGIIFTTDIAKMKISKQVAIEDEIKRNSYLEQEFYGQVPKK